LVCFKVIFVSENELEGVIPF